MMKKNLRRRQVLKGAMGTLGILGGGQALAAVSCKTSPAQPEGPFYPIHEQVDKDMNMVELEGHSEVAQGEQVYIKGKVLDSLCQPVEGALVDLWQACYTGKYKHEADPNSAELDPHFQYWAKVLTDANGEWMVKTIIPGAYPASATWVRPPHIHFRISKTGYHTLTTQMYFDDERFADLNANDRLLQSLPEAEQKKLLVQFKEELLVNNPYGEPRIKQVGHFDINLQPV